MSDFSSEWLTLREGADARARNPGVAEALAARLQLRETVSVIDLGCGSGANLRVTAPLLPPLQSWTLVDLDAGLIRCAKSALAAWADEAAADGEELRLRKGSADIVVRFKQADLARDLPLILESGADLVTASAFFDLVSAEFIRTLARALAQMRAAFYGALIYNGVERWTPHRPADNQMSSAFHRHQLRDKGFGPAAGPMAPAHLADQFRLNGYAVIEGDSPWRLTRGDRRLIEELARGHAMAAGETGFVDAKTIEAWIKVIRTGAEIGHTDIFAAPS